MRSSGCILLTPTRVTLSGARPTAAAAASILPPTSVSASRTAAASPSLSGAACMMAHSGSDYCNLSGTRLDSSLPDMLSGCAVFRTRRLLRLNLGCGLKKIEGWVNVDRSPACEPDAVVNLEEFPWPFADDSAEEVVLRHVLEHLGATPDIYQGIFRELYRVCAPDARIRITVPHPRHDDFLSDPTHVRPVTPQGLELFDRAKNREWAAKGMPNSPLRLYL